MQSLNINRKSILCLVALLLAVSAPSSAETTAARFRQLSLGDGLSQSAVNVIHQDHHGFMWFGTQEGLNRYDGHDFVVYQHDPAEPKSLSQDTVRAIVEDRNGVIWIGTDNGGLDRFDEADGTFTNFRHDPEDPNSLSGDRVRTILQDKDGNLWIGTDGGGLSRLDPTTNTFTRFLPDPDDPSSLSHPHVRAIHQTSSGELWVGTQGGGLNVFDSATQSFRHYRHDPSDPTSLSDDHIYSVNEDATGVLWIGTAQGGLNRFEPATSSFTGYPSGDLHNLPTGAVRVIFQERSGRLLVGTENGLAEWNPETEKFKTYQHDPADPYSLSHNRVISIYQDKGGVIWLGTLKGLNKWNPSTAAFPSFKAKPDDPTRLSNGYVSSFAEGLDGAVWIGTLGGLNRFDRTSRTFRRYTHDPGEASSLVDDRVGSLRAGRDGSVWVGTYASGLDRFDPVTQSFKHFQHRPDDPSSLSFNGVTAIHEDRQGTLWIGTYRGGLNRMVRESGDFVHYRHDPADDTSLSSDRVIAIHEDRGGHLWIGTDGGGLNRLDRRSGHFEHFRTDPQNPTSLSSDHVWTISEGPDGDLWIGTQGGGLNRWRASDRRTGKATFERYTKKDGLLSTVIYASLWDDTKNLWLSTNRGLLVLDPVSGTFRNYNRIHGLQDEEFNFAAALRARDGQMFFGGINGFNVFSPEKIRTNDYVPPVVLTSFLKSNSPAKLDQPIHHVGKIDLTYRDTVISFEFAALDFTAPEKNRYRYKLEGFDRDWVDFGNRYRVTYTNLDPGDYTFHVQGANNDGLWNRAGASVGLHQAPPPWATWWAYSGYALIAAVALGVYTRGQRFKRQRAAELERSNTELEHEIQVREQAESSLRKLSLAVEQSPASVVITDRDGKIDYVNPKFEEITGYERGEVQGESLAVLQSGYTAADQYGALWESVLSGQRWQGEFHTRKKNGELFWEQVSISPILSGEGEITHLLAVNEDVTAQKQYEERLLRQAHFDHLTELPNRTLALDRLSLALIRNRRENDPLALFFLDLDNFKIVNDTLGHSAGDQLLVATAQRLSTAVRDSDTVARLGGDEFLLMIHDLRDLVEVESSAQRILECFAEPFSIEGRELFVTASLGITLSPSDGVDPHVLMRNADAAMYKAKEAGRDAYQFFTPAMNTHAEARLQLESNLRQALDRREFYLEFQPVVDAKSREILSAEALLRWKNPNLGHVSPTSFIPVAEDTGLIVSIGDWVLKEACRRARNWELLHGVPLRVAVNVSSRQFRSGDLVKSVSRALDECDLHPSLLELEVTENVLVDDAPTTAATLRALNDMGVRLAVDDFGTGYSSLSYLQKFPFDMLKIDRAFVADLQGNNGNSTLVKAIIAMAGGLDLQVIAEGVETEQQLERLSSMGCGLVQGFYFSRPVAPQKIAELLTTGSKRITAISTPRSAVAS